jgi:4-hydroxybenzoate polyprenyltransferase
MFKHSIFSLPFIFIAMLVSANGWFGLELLALGVLAALSARNFAMGYNRFVDRDIDALNPRTASRPSVDGRVSPKFQMLFIASNALVFVVVAFFINMTAFYLSVPVLILLGAYSHFKRFSSYAHLFLGLTLGLAPLAGSIAVSATTPLWAWLLSLGVVFWVAGFDLLYSLQDIEFDKQNALYSVPSVYGQKATLFIAQIFHLLTIIFWTLFAFAIEGGVFVFLAVVIAAAMLAYEHKIVNQNIQHINKAFFVVNGYLGIVFFVFIIFNYMG